MARHCTFCCVPCFLFLIKMSSIEGHKILPHCFPVAKYSTLWIYQNLCNQFYFGGCLDCLRSLFYQFTCMQLYYVSFGVVCWA